MQRSVAPPRLLLAQIFLEKNRMHQTAATQTVVSKPCFFWNLCERRAALEKAGRSVCHGCASRLNGREYPLRVESREALYLTGRAAAEALDMIENS